MMNGKDDKRRIEEWEGEQDWDKGDDPGFFKKLGQTVWPGGEPGFIDLYKYIIWYM